MVVQIGWNLEEELPDSLASVKWSSVDFDYDSLLFVPDKMRGVYIVSVNSDVFDGMKPFNCFETPAYIGHTTNMRRRFQAHTAGVQSDALWRRMSFKARKSCTFWFATFPSDTTTTALKIVEQKLIDFYGSPLNRINSVKMGSTINGYT